MFPHRARGRTVIDRDGEAIGDVESPIDDEETKVRFLEVKGGGFLGIGGETRLLPVDAITSLTEAKCTSIRRESTSRGSQPHDPELARDADT